MARNVPIVIALSRRTLSRSTFDENSLLGLRVDGRYGYLCASAQQPVAAFDGTYLGVSAIPQPALGQALRARRDLQPKRSPAFTCTAFALTELDCRQRTRRPRTKTSPPRPPLCSRTCAPSHSPLANRAGRGTHLALASPSLVVSAAAGIWATWAILAIGG